MNLKGTKSSAERPVSESVNHGLSLQSSLSGSLSHHASSGRSSHRKGWERAAAFTGVRSGLILDMLRMVLLKISGEDLLKSGKESAIHSFNGGALSEGAAALNPVQSKAVYKSLMAVMSSVGDQETKQSSGVIDSRPQALNTLNSTLVPVNPFSGGRMIEDRKIYRQTFVIRSYEVGADRTASIETLTNLFQVSITAWKQSFLWRRLQVLGTLVLDLRKPSMYVQYLGRGLELCPRPVWSISCTRPSQMLVFECNTV